MACEGTRWGHGGDGCEAGEKGGVIGYFSRGGQRELGAEINGRV